jgi:hypothetical protein
MQTPEDRIRKHYKAIRKRMDSGWYSWDFDPILSLARKWKRPCWEIRAIIKKTGMYRDEV